MFTSTSARFSLSLTLVLFSTLQVSAQAFFPQKLDKGDSLSLEIYNGGCYGGSTYKVLATRHDTSLLKVDYISFKPARYKLSELSECKGCRGMKKKNKAFLKKHDLQLDTFYTIQDEHFDTVFMTDESFFSIEIAHDEIVDTSLFIPKEDLSKIETICQKFQLQNPDNYNGISGSHGSLIISGFDAKKNNSYQSEIIKFKGTLPLRRNNITRLK